jgi:uncharacterized protein YdaU (DUF1376 family)
VNYYERHIGDYLKDTAHLSLLEHGVYGRLLDVYYTREGSIPVEQAERLIGARSKDERAALAVVLQEFFQEDGGELRHSRCDREIQRFQDKQRKASASANARWSKASAHSEGNANALPNAMRTHSKGNAPSNQTPDTREKTKTARKRAAAAQLVSLDDLVAEGVDRQHAVDWLATRKVKALPLTPTAWADTKAEAVKAGLTAAEAVALSARQSWAGFKASWTAEKGSHGQQPSAANVGRIDIFAANER